MLSNTIQNRVLQLNPWLTRPESAGDFLKRVIPEPYVPRQLIAAPSKKNRAIVIVGPRQAGKSTYVWHRLQDFWPKILFLNMEDPLLRNGGLTALDLADFIRENCPFVKAVFMDEIQHLDEAGLFVKSLVDARLDIPLWVTGSSAFDLKSRTRESLAGRATRRRLLPFSLPELLAGANPANPLARGRLCADIIQQQTIFGSYPDVWLAPEASEKQLLLSDLVDALILRDASDLFRIKRVDAFRRLLALLAGQIGNLINLSELAALCNVDVSTVRSYIEIMEESHILKAMRPFAGGRRRELTGTPKVFFLDNGVRNQLLNNFSKDISTRPDAGPLTENWAFTEIAKAAPFQADVKFWRSKGKAEVDFVIEYANSISGLEIKTGPLRRPTVSRSSRSFIDAYAPERFAVLNRDLSRDDQLGKTQLSFITHGELTSWLAVVFG